MSRTPSMTVAEAESAIGARPVSVDASNRGLLRKWLTAHGLPGAYVATLAMPKLGLVYNDVSGFHLKALREQAESDLADCDEPELPRVAAQSNGHALGNGHDTASDAVRAVETLRELFGRNQSIDENKVRAIVRDELPSLIPVTRLEIITNGETRDHGAKSRHKLLPQLIQAVAQAVPVLQVGPAGSGKSTAGEQVAESLGMRFFLQGAASGTHEYLGYKDGAGQYHSTPFREAFEHGGLFVAEELDSGDASVPLILNAGLANGHMSFPDSASPIKRHADFRIIANANTYGNGADRIYVGRTQLDGATIDRFAFLTWTYDEVLERSLAGNDSWCDRVIALRKAASDEKARIIISPRASINGAKMLAAGWTRYQVEESFIWKGCEAELRRRIEARCA